MWKLVNRSMMQQTAVQILQNNCSYSTFHTKSNLDRKWGLSARDLLVATMNWCLFSQIYDRLEASDVNLTALSTLWACRGKTGVNSQTLIKDSSSSFVRCVTQGGTWHCMVEISTNSLQSLASKLILGSLVGINSLSGPDLISRILSTATW